jgi:hypothetical protein
MTEPFYVSKAAIQKIEGLHRRARLEVGPVVDFGVHGPVKDHYKLHGAPDLPVAATGG